MIGRLFSHNPGKNREKPRPSTREHDLRLVIFTWSLKEQLTNHRLMTDTNNCPRIRITGKRNLPQTAFLKINTWIISTLFYFLNSTLKWHGDRRPEFQKYFFTQARVLLVVLIQGIHTSVQNVSWLHFAKKCPSPLSRLDLKILFVCARTYGSHFGSRNVSERIQTSNTDESAFHSVCGSLDWNLPRIGFWRRDSICRGGSGSLSLGFPHFRLRNFGDGGFELATTTSSLSRIDHFVQQRYLPSHWNMIKCNIYAFYCRNYEGR